MQLQFNQHMVNIMCAVIICFLNADAEPVLEFVKFISLHEKSMQKTFENVDKWHLAANCSLFAWIFALVRPFSLSLSLWCCLLKISTLFGISRILLRTFLTTKSICLSLIFVLLASFFFFLKNLFSSLFFSLPLLRMFIIFFFGWKVILCTTNDALYVLIWWLKFIKRHLHKNNLL